MSYIAGDGPIQVIGPAFSGSVDSINCALKDVQPQREFQFFNGAATSEDALKKLGDFVVGGATKKPSLVNLVGSDTKGMAGITTWLSSQAVHPEKMVLLAEDETAFGSQSFGNPIATIRFPREISRLRNAAQAIQAARATGTEAQQFRFKVPFSLQDLTALSDSVPGFSERAAASQEAVFLNVWREMRSKHYSHVGILGTDPMDVVFLSRIVKEANPDVRLFMLDADMLYARAAGDASLDGTLSVTKYPLIPELRPVECSTKTAYTAFPDSAAEATYQAAKLAFQAVKDPCKALGKGEEELPLWITVLSRTGYWPVAQMGGKRSDLTPSKGPPGQTWTILFLLVSAFGLFHAGCVIYLHAFLPRSKTAEVGRWLHSFWLNPGDSGWDARFSYLLAKTLALLTFYWVLGAPAWRMGASTIGELTLLLALGLVTVTALVIAAGAVVWSASGTGRWATTVLPHIWATLLALVAAVWFIWNWTVLVTGDGANRVNEFAAMRAVHLLSGVSPMLPVLLAGAGILWWAWVHMRRLILVEKRTPLLPEIAEDGSEAAFVWLREDINKAVREPYLRCWRLTGGLVIFCVVALDPGGVMGTFEPSEFARVYPPLLGLLAMLIFLSLTRMLVIWDRLKLFLEQLERHPLRQAFTDLPQEKVWSPVFQRDVMQRTYKFEVRVLETARLLDTLGAPVTGWGESVTTLSNDVGANSARLAKGSEISVLAAHNVYGQIVEMAKAPIFYLREKDWKKGASDTLDAMEKKAESKVAPLKVGGKRSKLAAEFVALCYLAYIRTTLLQIRNLLLFVVAAFVLAVLSISSYPFQAPHLLGVCTGMALVFGGIGVVRVLAQMARDPILSRITQTTPGELDKDFYWRLLVAGGLPVLSVVISQFPSFGRFFYSWLQPAIQGLK